MKKLKTFKLLLVAIQWFLGVDEGELEVRDTWSYVAPQPPKKVKVMKNNYSNLLLAMRVNGSRLYDYVILLVDYVRRRTRYGTYYMMMSLPNANQVVKGVLDMTGDNKSTTIGTGRQIILDCTANPNVTVAAGLLAAGTTGIDNYESARGTAIPEYYREMINAMEPILALFNDFVKLPANRVHAVSTIQSGGFHVVGPGGSHLAVFGVRNSVVAGEFLLTGDVDQDGKDGLHLWWYCIDGTTWIPMRSTKKNKTKMGGFTRGELVSFKHELVIDDDNNPYPVSNPIAKTAQ